MDECKHELILQECSLCNGKQKYDYTRVDVKSPWFPAKYNGSCRHCGDSIKVGDEIRFMNEEVVCDFCGRDY